MKLMVALIISSLVESIKSGLPNKNVLTTEFSFSANVLELILLRWLAWLI